MLIRYKIPKTILWVINLFVIFLIIFTLFRLVTFLAFKPRALGFGDMLPSFALGIQYDLRWISIILLPIVLISMAPRFSPFYSARNKKWWTWYLAVITFIAWFFLTPDHNFSMALMSMAFASASGSAVAALGAPPAVSGETTTSQKQDRLQTSPKDMACRGQTWGAESDECLVMIAREAGRGDDFKVRKLASAEAPVTAVF